MSSHSLLGAPKGLPIVTPLMEYVRQKRAAKGGARVGNSIICLLKPGFLVFHVVDLFLFYSVSVLLWNFWSNFKTCPYFFHNLRQRSVLNGKSTRSVNGILSRSPVSGASKRGSEKQRNSTTMVNGFFFLFLVNLWLTHSAMMTVVLRIDIIIRNFWFSGMQRR